MLIMVWFWLGDVEVVVVKVSEWLEVIGSKVYFIYDFILFYWLCVYMYINRLNIIGMYIFYVWLIYKKCRGYSWINRKVFENFKYLFCLLIKYKIRKIFWT